MNINLTNKHALVCGSTQGIGKACAIALAELGATVTLLARNKEKLLATLAVIPTPVQQVHHYLVADFSDSAQVETVVSNQLAKNGQVFHILINNTGGPPSGAITEAMPKDFIQAYNNHLICNHILAKLLVTGMKETGYGRIINIISTSVKQPIPNLGVSNTTRWAVASWAKTWANEVGQFGITVNNVLPGFTNTQRLQNIISAKAQKATVSTAIMASQMKASVPMQRFGTAKEIANAVAFLASPAASYINGINLPVDGGRTKSL